MIAEMGEDDNRRKRMKIFHSRKWLFVGLLVTATMQLQAQYQPPIQRHSNRV
jgi:hypothetical protein